MIGLPEQPLIVGVTVMVAVMGSVVLLAEEKLGTFPVPLAGSPIVVLELVHEKVAPVGMLLKLAEDIVAPAQLVIFAGASIRGKGSTVMV